MSPKTVDWPGPEDGTSTGRVVLAGFEPFYGRTENRSWELVRRLRGEPGRDVFRLPVEFGQLREIFSAILSREPSAILMVGESPIRQLRVEQIALNIADSDKPDNAGHIAHSEPIVEGGPLALMSSWNARAVAGRLHQEGVPAKVSFHAGTFACNAALYLALHAASGNGVREADREERRASGMGTNREARSRRVPAIGLLHIPNSRGPAGLGVGNLRKAVELGIEELLAIGEV